MHTECFLKYIRASCAPGGVLDGERYLGSFEQSNNLSGVGSLPCPLYLMERRCDCASLSDTKIRRVLACSEEVALYYKVAIRRIAYQVAESEAWSRLQIGPEQENDDQILPPALNWLSTSFRLRAAIELAVDEGLYIKCPNCHRACVKDDACMHVTCNTRGCGTQYCYCCGRERGHNSQNSRRCRGCDAINHFIDKQPGWEAFSIGCEASGYGALNEFRRQRIAYFVRRIKEETVRTAWEAFERDYSHILTNVPTQGRYILWEELDSSRAPTFGNSSEEDLLWKLPPLLMVAGRTDPAGNAAPAACNDVTQEASNSVRNEEQETTEIPDIPPFWPNLKPMLLIFHLIGGVTSSQECS